MAISLNVAPVFAENNSPVNGNVVMDLMQFYKKNKDNLEENNKPFCEVIFKLKDLQINVKSFG